MKHQQVSVDYWSMGKAMLTYAFMAAMGWLMLRLFNTVFMLPRRMRSQHESMQDTLEELQKRFPGLNFTEQDLKDAEKELEEIMKERKDKDQTEGEPIEENKDSDKISTETQQLTEDKKTI